MRLWPLALALVVAGCNQEVAEPVKDVPKTTPGAKETTAKGTKTGPITKLGIEDVKVGTGAVVAAGDECTVLYEGRLANGTVFDGNIGTDKPPFTFTAGPMGQVIEGWKQGVIGMKVGGERKLSIPAAMAYGAQGQGPIPANSDLFFTIQLKDVLKQEDRDTVQAKDVKAGAGPQIKSGDKITVSFTGKLRDGTEIDRGKWTFTVGQKEVIPGIDAGVVGMRRGGQRILTIPPLAAFGPLGKEPVVPPNQSVVYDITVFQIQ